MVQVRNFLLAWLCFLILFVFATSLAFPQTPSLKCNLDELRNVFGAPIGMENPAEAAIDEDWIVFSAEDTGIQPPPTQAPPRRIIWAYNIGTKTVTPLRRATGYNDFVDSKPQIYGDYVVWHHWQASTENEEIVLWDLKTMTAFPVIDMGGGTWFPKKTPPTMTVDASSNTLYIAWGDDFATTPSSLSAMANHACYVDLSPTAGRGQGTCQQFSEFYLPITFNGVGGGPYIPIVSAKSPYPFYKRGLRYPTVIWTGGPKQYLVYPLWLSGPWGGDHFVWGPKGQLINPPPPPTKPKYQYDRWEITDSFEEMAVISIMSERPPKAGPMATGRYFEAYSLFGGGVLQITPYQAAVSDSHGSFAKRTGQSGARTYFTWSRIRTIAGPPPSTTPPEVGVKFFVAGQSPPPYQTILTPPTVAGKRIVYIDPKIAQTAGQPSGQETKARVVFEERTVPTRGRQTSRIMLGDCEIR